MLTQMIRVNNDWDSILYEESRKKYFQELASFIDAEYARGKVYPPEEKIFNAFRLTPFNSLKIVILGQDPYHECGQAEGLAFSVPYGCPLPPSLNNIFKELKSDLGIEPPLSGSLRQWAERGVLLLNTALTVKEGEANSHKDKGWETFTDNIIKKISSKTAPVVFILWGGNARSKKPLINEKVHHIIESAHPSPLSAYNGFFGSRPFSRANIFLKQNAVDWRL
jgi:uracil-DNA glycosylase